MHVLTAMQVRAKQVRCRLRMPILGVYLIWEAMVVADTFPF